MTKQESINYILSESDIKIAIFNYLSDKFKENNVSHRYGTFEDIVLKYDNEYVYKDITAELKIEIEGEI